MKCVLVAVAGLLSLTSALVAPRQESAIAATDRLLFSTTIAAFEVARNAKNPSTLDWSSDGCSSSPDNPFGFNFIEECHRHDFGYRNYKAQGRFEAGKAKIDTNFKTDMYKQCETEGGVFEVAACKVSFDFVVVLEEREPLGELMV